jgi:hypothetical protein
VSTILEEMQISTSCNGIRLPDTVLSDTAWGANEGTGVC